MTDFVMQVISDSVAHLQQYGVQPTVQLPRVIVNHRSAFVLVLSLHPGSDLVQHKFLYMMWYLV